MHLFCRVPLHNIECATSLGPAHGCFRRMRNGYTGAMAKPWLLTEGRICHSRCPARGPSFGEEKQRRHRSRMTLCRHVRTHRLFCAVSRGRIRSMVVVGVMLLLPSACRHVIRADQTRPELQLANGACGATALGERANGKKGASMHRIR
jgi:hypothetical protein